jgi:hypothetical protein
VTVPPYSFDKKPQKDLTLVKPDRDDIDRLVSEQILKGQPTYKVPEICPNPWHSFRPWHGFPESGCPGSHVGVYEEPEECLVFNYFI